MKNSLRTVCASIATASALMANSPVFAERVPTADNFVFWRADEIPAGYRHMREIFSTDVVRRGVRETSLPQGPSLEIRYQHDGVMKSTDDFIRENRVAGLLILHHGKIVLERYGLDQKPTDYWTSNSVAKSFTSTLVGAAIRDGAIGSVNDRMSKYIPELAAGSFADVTVRDALLMASGVTWNEDYEDRDADSSKIRNLDFPGSTVPPLDIVDYMSHRPRGRLPDASSCTTPATRTCWACSCNAPQASRCPSICPKRSGHRPAWKRMLPSFEIVSDVPWAIAV